MWVGFVKPTVSLSDVRYWAVFLPPAPLRTKEAQAWRVEGLQMLRNGFVMQSTASETHWNIDVDPQRQATYGTYLAPRKTSPSAPQNHSGIDEMGTELCSCHRGIAALVDSLSSGCPRKATHTEVGVTTIWYRKKKDLLGDGAVSCYRLFLCQGLSWNTGRFISHIY